MNDYLRKLEGTIGSWYTGLPHLPESWRRWIANNCWWVVLIGVIIQVVSILWVLFLIAAGGLFLAAFLGAYMAIGAGIGLLIALIWLAAQILPLILSILAVRPLRAHRYRGWMLLFVMLLVTVASTVVGLLVYHNIISFIWNMVMIALSGYFLFEIRLYFGAGRIEAAPTTSATPEFKPKTGDSATPEV